MDFPKTNKPYNEGEPNTNFPDDDKIVDPAKALEELASNTNWPYLWKIYRYIFLITVVSAFILIYVIRLALHLPVWK